MPLSFSSAICPLGLSFDCDRLDSFLKVSSGRNGHAIDDITHVIPNVDLIAVIQFGE